MHCAVCRKPLELTAGSPRAVCDRCANVSQVASTPEVSKIPRPKRRRTRAGQVGKRSPGSGSEFAKENRQTVNRPSKALPATAIPAVSQQTIKSARSVARAWRDSTKEYNQQRMEAGGRLTRIDSAHKMGESPTFVKSKSVNPSRPNSEAGLASVRNAISFGLFVFLIGQALTMGAYVVGNTGAWTTGFLFSIGGITVSILSINEALRRLE